MTHFRRRAIGALLASTLVLAGCTSQGPGMPERPGEKHMVSIGVDPEDPEQVVLAEIYHQIFLSLGRNSAVTEAETGPDTSAADILTTQNVNFTLACTGELLNKVDPVTAAEVAEKYSGEDSVAGSEEASVATYDATVGVFPGDLMTVDPSPAQGCEEAAEAGPGLPQNIIPVFKKNMFTRGQVQRINFITRVLNTKDLSEMSERVADGEPVNEVVADWLLEYAGIDPNVRVDDPAEVTQEQAPG